MQRLQPLHHLAKVGWRRVTTLLPQRPLERVRLLFLLANPITIPFVLFRQMHTSQAPWLVRAVSIVALALLLAWWVRGYSKRHFPTWSILPEGVALVVIAAPMGGPLRLLGFMSISVAFRSLYGRGWAGLLPTVVYGLTILPGEALSALYPFPPDPLLSPFQVPAMMTVGVTMWLLAGGLEAQEAALERQRKLTMAGEMLVAAGERPDVIAAGVRAAQDLLGGNHPVLIQSRGEDVSVTGLHLPLTGHSGGQGALLVEGTTELPQATREALESLCTLIAFRLEAAETIELREEAADLRNQAAESRAQSLAELNRFKDELLGNMAHELRTPLTSIRAYSELLLNYDIEADERQEFLNIINSESERLARLVNDVLDIRKIESGSLSWNMAPLDVANLLHDASRIWAPLVVKEGLDFDLACEDNLPAVQGDRDRMLQVLGNLMNNALKFTLDGSIHLAARTAGDNVLITVTDTGIGIDAADRERIFDKFQQGRVTPDGKNHGTGLGLAICRQIVEYHSGRIWVEPGPNGGSTFTVSLVARALSPEAAADAQTPQPADSPMGASGEDDPLGRR